MTLEFCMNQLETEQNSANTVRSPDLGFIVTVPAIKYLATARRPYLAFPLVVHAPGVQGNK